MMITCTVSVVCTHSLFEVRVSVETDVSTRVPYSHQAIVRVDSHDMDLTVAGLPRAPQPTHADVHRAGLGPPRHQPRVQLLHQTEVRNTPWNNTITMDHLLTGSSHEYQ
jgi:hypothetical protein